MTDRMTWLRTRVRIGGLLLVAGVALFAGSVAAQLANPESTFNFRIVGGVGIALAGGGVGMLVRYLPALRSEPAARRILAEERDERSIQIRQRAASRAYWVSVAVVFTGLMWTSFAANGELPKLEGDALWNFLAAAVMVPFAVYVASLLLDERNG